MPAPEQVRIGGSKVDQVNMQARGQQVDVLAVLASTLADGKDPMLESDVANNAILALAADQGQFDAAKSGTRVSGTPGSVIRHLTVRTADFASFDGVRFLGSDSTTLVDITAATSTAVFTNCRFSKPAGVGGVYVALVAGARAHFVGCIFDGAQTLGNTINNAGAAANVFVIGCSRKTGTANVNVTVISETV